ncbi:MAG: lipid-A-disaccharide synthase [Proteobacteria bacterium]|nr:lipid-A-disaccharide synthase [Pseudomonadota bacterium]
MTDPRSSLKVFLVAGEPSGDALASKLMEAIKAKANVPVSFIGVGGPLMEKQGLKSLFPMDDLTVMGVFEVLPRLPNLLRRISETAEAALEEKPDVFISVDAPDFSFRVAKMLKDAPFTKVHYVAPSVWAWRPGRAAKIARLYDHLLTLLPFEPPYFEKEGLSATFIGHSVVETGADDGDGAGFRATHGIAPEEILLMMLPGSRRSEVTRLLPIFKDAVKFLTGELGEFKIVVPVVGKSAEYVRESLAPWAEKVILVEGITNKYDAMAASNVGLAASGTVGLELALARLPHIIAYKMNPITTFIGRRLVKLEFANLVNIMMKREVVPEIMLEDCTAENLFEALMELFRSEEKRHQQIELFQEAMVMLGKDDVAPGARAADVIFDLIPQKDTT